MRTKLLTSPRPSPRTFGRSAVGMTNGRGGITKIEMPNKAFTLIVLLLFLPVLSFAQTISFDPGLLISDQRFGNVEAFASADAVQRFLELKNSVLANTSVEFLKQLKEPADVALKQRLEDPNPNLGRLRTAAELVYDAAQRAQINPQVILATLQKEQSLIGSDSSRLQRRLDRALGYACPDGGSCSDLFLSFYFQLFGNVDNEDNRYLGAVRSLSKSFYTPSGRGPLVDAAGRTYGSASKIRTSRVGDTITVDNTRGSPYFASATQSVTLNNAATAALYRYTPHVYNGNYNFWKFFTEWFRFTNGSLLKKSDANQVYYIDNGMLRLVSGTVMTQRQLDIRQAFIVTQSELDEFDLAAPLPPQEGTLVAPSSGGVTYLVEENELHELSEFVAGLRGLDMSQTVFLPDSEVASYAVGKRALPPKDSLLRSVSNPEVYIVEGGKLRPISGFVFTQRSFKFSNVVHAPDTEVGLMPRGQILPPLDGTLVKAADLPLIYYVALGQKFPIPYFVFQARNFRFSEVVTLGDDEIGNLTSAEHFAPADGTLLKAQSDPTVYFVEASSLHGITGFLFQHKGLKFSDIIEVTPQELNLIPMNTALFLPDETLIKIEGEATVYVIEDGNKHALTYEAFTNRNYDFSDVVEVPQIEADRYPSGSLYMQ